MRCSPLVWALPLLLAGCSAKDAVSLSVRISPATVTLQNGAFGHSASGSFQTKLTLGPEASGPTMVSAENFALQTQSGQPLIDVLMLTPDMTFPLNVGKGESKTVTFTFTDQLLDHDAACGDPLEILGSFSDTLKGGTDSTMSDPITPSCG
jgi:hypothetical protein